MKYAIKVWLGEHPDEWVWQVKFSRDQEVMLYDSLEEASAVAQCFRKAVVVEWENV